LSHILFQGFLVYQIDGVFQFTVHSFSFHQNHKICSLS